MAGPSEVPVKATAPCFVSPSQTSALTVIRARLIGSYGTTSLFHSRARSPGWEPGYRPMTCGYRPPGHKAGTGFGTATPRATCRIHRREPVAASGPSSRSVAPGEEEG
jgi:hypothetical protein